MLAKQALKDAHLIITKHNKKSAQKAIAKFQTLITLKPKIGNKTIFQNKDTPPLDSTLDNNNNILTNPIDIANKIFIQ